MSPSILEIFCVILAASGVAHSLTFDDDLPLHELAQVYDHWDLKSWKDQYEKPFMRFYQRKYVVPDSLKVFYKYPLYHIEEFPNDKSQDVKLSSASFKSDTGEKNSLTSIINSVASSDLATNSISTSGKINPENSGNTISPDSNTEASRQDETHPSSPENITSMESTPSSYTEDFKSLSTSREPLSTAKNAEDSNISINSTNEDSTSTSDSALNSETVEDHQPINAHTTSASDTDSSSVQSTVSSANNSSYSISNTPNLTTNETNVDGISTTSFKPLTGEYTQSTDSENVYSTFTDSSTKNISRQPINRITDKADETTTIMTSGDEDTVLTKMTKQPTSEIVFHSSKSTILSTRVSYSSASYMTSSSNKERPTANIYSTSTDELELHERRDRLIIAEPETVIEISSIRTAKVVVSVVFLSIALVATAVLTVYMIKVKRREVQYDQLTLLP